MLESGAVKSHKKLRKLCSMKITQCPLTSQRRDKKEWPKNLREQKIHKLSGVDHNDE